MESHSQIEDEAAEWLARRDSENWSEHDEARLQRWIEASTARRIAYLRLKSTWDAAARLRTLRAGPMPGASAEMNVPSPDDLRRAPFFEQSPILRRPAPVGSALEVGSDDTTSADNPGAAVSIPPRRRTFPRGPAAVSVIVLTIVLAVAAALGAYQLGIGRGDRYSTAVGGFASVPMADGSKVTLNTDSEIRVAITSKERRIDLDQGEAFFEVAHDETRPFIVRAGSKRVVAIGTQFSVQHLGEVVRVLVTEGRVRVENSDSAGSADGDLDAGAVLLSAGDMARARQSAMVVQKSLPPQVEDSLSWREGYLRFHETPLADAVAEMNRYNRPKILIDDPRLAALRISGTFRPTQYEAFVRVLQDGFSIHARTAGERIVLTQEP